MRRASSFVASSCVALSLALGTLPCFAAEAPKRLAVLPVLEGDAPGLSVGEVFRGVDRGASARPVRPMSVDAYFFQDGRELSNRALSCGGDTQCLADALAVFRADLGLVVIANAALDPPLLSLVLLESATREVVGDRHGTWTADAPFAEQLSGLLAGLLDDAGLRQLGFLEVLVEPASAVVRVGDGWPADEGAAHRYTLPPGPYPVRADASNHQRAERAVEVRPGELTRVELRLESSGSLTSSPWFWGGVVAVVAAGAAATIVALGQPPSGCLCVTSAGEGPCVVCR